MSSTVRQESIAAAAAAAVAAAAASKQQEAPPRMSSKRPRGESPPSGAQVSPAASPCSSPETRDLERRSPAELERQPKRQKGTQAAGRLNFSIESIMEPTSADSDCEHQKRAHNQAINSYLAIKQSHLFVDQVAASLLSSAASSGSLQHAAAASLAPDSPDMEPASGRDSAAVSACEPSSGSSSRETSPVPSLDGHPQRHSAGSDSTEKSLASQRPRAGTTGGGSSKAAGRNSAGSTNHLLRPVCTDARLAPFECHLDNLELWHRFHPLDTEMIITKQGRRMFPPVRVTFSLAAGEPLGQQLNPREKYQVLMDILPYDNKRYRYAYHKSSWQQAGKADPPSPTKLFLHPDGPFTLEQLKRQVISFEKIKLTNNDASKHGYIVLNSMHKYQPRIHLVLWKGKESQNLANAPIALLEQEIHKTFIFSETIFTAVTAYQNHSITKLKIDSNPFAKGFRDSSRLTDLELESMQDLMTDGQCPFSPPRAPPPGFPHFLFAAAAAQHAAVAAAQHMQQQQQPSPVSQKLGASGGTGGGGPPTHHQIPEDPTSVLLRERTLMSLDSFLQQQSQHFSQQQLLAAAGNQPPGATNHLLHQHPASFHQHQIRSPPAERPSTSPIARPAPDLHQHPNQQQQQQQPPPPPPSYLDGPRHPMNFEQLILQQQQHFAAAMAAAAGGAPNPHQFQQALLAAHHHQQMASLSMHLSGQHSGPRGGATVGGQLAAEAPATRLGAKGQQPASAHLAGAHITKI